MYHGGRSSFYLFLTPISKMLIKTSNIISKILIIVQNYIIKILIENFYVKKKDFGEIKKTGQNTKAKSAL